MPFGLKCTRAFAQLKSAMLAYELDPVNRRSMTKATAGLGPMTLTGSLYNRVSPELPECEVPGRGRRR